MPSFAAPPTHPSSARRKTLAGFAAAQATANRAPSLILPRLYLTNWTVAANEALLTELGVTHVVSVLEFPPEYTGAMKTLHVRVEDSFRTDILSHLDETTEFIRTALGENETNKVLVRDRGRSVFTRVALTGRLAGALSHGRVPLDDSRLRVPHRDGADECVGGDRLRCRATRNSLTERRFPSPVGDVRATICHARSQVASDRGCPCGKSENPSRP